MREKQMTAAQRAVTAKIQVGIRGFDSITGCGKTVFSMEFPINESGIEPVDVYAGPSRMPPGTVRAVEEARLREEQRRRRQEIAAQRRVIGDLSVTEQVLRGPDIPRPPAGPLSSAAPAAQHDSRELGRG
jgi:hypothetical protein